MTIENVSSDLFDTLKTLYSSREAGKIVHRVIERLTGYSPTMQLVHKKDPLPDDKISEFKRMKSLLKKNTPLQYVLEEAWFFGMQFYVDQSVLIPRPETEELVEWLLDSFSHSHNQPVSVLDIGTGSGCIAVSIKKAKPEWDVRALDKFSEALNIARKNAALQQADIHFIQADILDEKTISELLFFDMIVSNPPYIPLAERSQMDKHVAGQEPDAALFVPDNDPLIFYKKILELAKQKLNPGGKIFVEIHEELGKEVRELFEKYFENVILKKDMSGKDRMICGEGIK